MLLPCPGRTRWQRDSSSPGSGRAPLLGPGEPSCLVGAGRVGTRSGWPCAVPGRPAAPRPHAGADEENPLCRPGAVPEIAVSAPKKSSSGSRANASSSSRPSDRRGRAHGAFRSSPRRPAARSAGVDGQQLEARKMPVNNASIRPIVRGARATESCWPVTWNNAAPGHVHRREFVEPGPRIEAGYAVDEPGQNRVSLTRCVAPPKPRRQGRGAGLRLVLEFRHSKGRSARSRRGQRSPGIRGAPDYRNRGRGGSTP